MGNALQDQTGKGGSAYQMLSIRPDYAEAYNNMGNALRDQVKLEDALEAYRKAVTSGQIVPRFIIIWIIHLETKVSSNR